MCLFRFLDINFFCLHIEHCLAVRQGGWWGWGTEEGGGGGWKIAFTKVAHSNIVPQRQTTEQEGKKDSFELLHIKNRSNSFDLYVCQFGFLIRMEIFYFSEVDKSTESQNLAHK